MERVSLRRFTPLDKSDQGMFGRVRCSGLTLFTMELPWRNNARNISCVPGGPLENPEVYPMLWTYSPRFKRFMYLMGDTDPRTGIRAHPANWAGDKAKNYLSQLNGCLALGEKYGTMGGQKAIMVSRPAVRRFEEHMQHKPFELEVINICSV